MSALRPIPQQRANFPLSQTRLRVWLPSSSYPAPYHTSAFGLHEPGRPASLYPARRPKAQAIFARALLKDIHAKHECPLSTSCHTIYLEPTSCHTIYLEPSSHPAPYHTSAFGLPYTPGRPASSQVCALSDIIQRAASSGACSLLSQPLRLAKYCLLRPSLMMAEVPCASSTRSSANNETP